MIYKTNFAGMFINKNSCILICILIFFSTLHAFENKTIDIAAIYALTGRAAKNNSFSLEGINYGVDEINKAGGILGKKIKLLTFDNQSTPIGSSLAVNRAEKSNVAKGSLSANSLL